MTQTSVRRARLAATDAALVRAARQGDRDAFAVIVERYGPDLYRYAARMLAGNLADAGEVVQDAFVSAWTSLARFEERSSLRTWLFRITHRRAVDLARRRTPIPVADEVLADVLGDQWAQARPPEPEQVVIDAELVAELQQALAELPEMQRAVWLLREVEELSYDDIAETLTTSRDTVRGALARARATLAERLASWR